MAGQANLKKIFGGSGAGLSLRGTQTHTPAVGIGGLAVNELNLSGAGQTVLNLTGKWAVDFITLTTTDSSGTMTIEITVDGEVIYNGPIVIATRTSIIGSPAMGSSSVIPISVPITCLSSFVVKATRNNANTTNLEARAFAIN